MTAERSDRCSRRLTLAIVLVASLAIAVLSAALPASAATPTCTPVPNKTTCLVGTLPVVPAGGIKLDITGPGGLQVVTTDNKGVWTATITRPGNYKVTVDTSTLPQGVTVNGSPTATLTNVTLGAQRGAVFSFRGKAVTSASNSGKVTSKFDQMKIDAVFGLRLGLLLALASIGLSLIYGTTGLSNFAHAEQVTMGGLLAHVLVKQIGVPFILATVIVVGFCACTGFAQDLVIWRPLRHRSLGLTQMMIVTIGLSLALQYVFQIFIGVSTVQVTNTIAKPLYIWGVPLPAPHIYAMLVAAACIGGVAFFLLRTRIGRATRAVSDNPDLASASGIDVDLVIRLVWMMAAGLAGLAGVLYAMVYSGVKWDTGMQILLLMFAAVTLGGLGTAFGALVGSLIIGMVVEMSTLVLPDDFKYATALLILILLLLVRPQGIMGRRERVG